MSLVASIRKRCAFYVNSCGMMCTGIGTAQSPTAIGTQGIQPSALVLLYQAAGIRDSATVEE